jgi:N-acetylglucosamine-6-phosphate deacetylase
LEHFPAATGQRDGHAETSANQKSPSVLIHSARMVTGGEVKEDAWIAFEGKTIDVVGAGDSWKRYVNGARKPRPEIVHAGGQWLLPGFVDIHCHGGGGHSFESADHAPLALDLHRRHGTTRSVLSLVSNPLPVLRQQITAAGELMAADELVLGVHLEGPFLDAGHKGAHDALSLRVPDPETNAELMSLGAGLIRQITLAPELPGAMEAIGSWAAQGTTVAIGHTNADFSTSLAAFDAGATVLTHAFNAMNGLHHRAPGPVAAAIRRDGVTLEIVNDGVHVHPEVVRMAFSAAPGRVALVSDAMAAAGAEDGEYRLGALSVTVRGNRAVLTQGGVLAGSTLTLDAALAQAVNVVGLDIAATALALTEIPAKAIGYGDRLGRLASGYAADAVLLNAELEVQGVWAAGSRRR